MKAIGRKLFFTGDAGCNGADNRLNGKHFSATLKAYIN